ncbi:WAP four-disulfide core domain protein 2 isoform X1 [Rattus norvegicus]|uniref:WAP four-disulfide core domain protein 2 isoform X1 n=1 Tax=Rattus norvegicus TaxID=10116 RepID=UPI002FD7A2D7
MGIPDPGTPEKRWKPDPHVPSFVCPGVDAKDKGVTEARPRRRRSPSFLAGLDSLVHDGLPGMHRLSEGKLSRTATGTTTLSAGLARTSPLSRGQVSTKPPVVTKEGGNGEKQGTCPSVDFPKLGLCEDQCQMDSQCSGNMKCCRNGCGKMGCTTPKF